MYSEKERLYMVKAIRYVTDAFINPGSGILDFLDTIDIVKPDVFVVNSDGGSDLKRRLCTERGIEYVELERVPEAGLDARSTTSLRTNVNLHLSYRIDIAGTWIDRIRDKALAWKMLGAGGSGHLALVLSDNATLTEEMIPIKIRRRGF